MIDALFGSKTRVKLLHLFLNHPGQAFYVREITRLINEQINSVRRELSNMLAVGVITSTSSENKLYYEANQRYEYYVALKAIFADDAESQVLALAGAGADANAVNTLGELKGVRLVVIAGVLVKGSTSPVDILVVGDTVSASQLKKAVSSVEAQEGRQLNYTHLRYDDFYYRLSMRDRFITEIINAKHSIVTDTDGILERQER